MPGEKERSGTLGDDAEPPSPPELPDIAGVYEPGESRSYAPRRYTTDQQRRYGESLQEAVGVQEEVAARDAMAEEAARCRTYVPAMKYSSTHTRAHKVLCTCTHMHALMFSYSR